MDPYEQSKSKTKRYKKLKTLLKMVYDYDSFRPKQYEIINRIVMGQDVCAVLPTGFGKSLTFQMPALYLDKPAIIISPLISLMDDQRMILDELGISSCCYNSAVGDKGRMRTEILQSKYKFVYITPETIIHMQDFLKRLEEIQGISLVAIDEAHCISSYGFDFRTSYRKLTFLKEIFPQIPILALTATATTVVGKDICQVLGLNTQEPIITSFDRPNLYLEVRKKGKNMAQDLVPIIKEHPKQSIIIYCLTKKETAKIADILTRHKIKCGIYHAGMDPDEKAESHHNFINGKINVIVATIAFGMGINKSNVRVVIHYGSPKNIEGYYQEIGRGGRDGLKAWCYAFYNFRDFKVQESFIANGNNVNYQKLQFKLLEQMKHFMTTTKCRRTILLEYFDEEYKGKCNFCDNCTGVKKEEVFIITTDQDVQIEAKLLIDLIESIKNRSFGMTMYINILRGSTNKTIGDVIKKNKYYAQGKHRSLEWWKELAENLVSRGYLQQVYVKSGRFPMQVVKTTRKGVTWANMADLDGMLGGINVDVLGLVRMASTS